jgi:hypothetical protein
VEPTRDGGYIAGGYSWPGAGGTKTETGYGDNDFWVTRLDASGNPLWDRCFGGTSYELLTSLAETTDGGFILAGQSESGVSGNKTSPGRGGGFSDFWIVRIDSNGNKLWDASFGGASPDELEVVRQTSDGGFILGGSSWSVPAGDFSNKSSPHWGGTDFWVVRVDAAGNKLWDRSFGGTQHDLLVALEEMPDGGFILGGSSASTGGNKSSLGFGGGDFWIVRLDANGNKLWDKSYGGSGGDGLLALKRTEDGFVLVGSSSSPDDGNKSSPGPPQGTSWIWLVRIDAEGTKLWDQTVPKGQYDVVRSCDRTPDGGYFLGGHRGAFGELISDLWIVRLDANGARLWETTYPGDALDDDVHSVRALPDGAFVVGATKYYGAAYDFRVIKLAPEHYTLSVATNFPGRGAIHVTPPPGPDGKYVGGTTVTLGASPEPGHDFSFWSGSISGTDNPTQVFMNGNKHVTAAFAVSTSPAVLAHSPSEISVLGGDAVSNATVHIWNAGGGTLNYAVTSNQPWIHLEPSSGASVGETNVHNLRFEVSSLLPGVHRAVITIDPQNIGLASETIDVTLRKQFGQPPRIQWQRILGGSEDDGAFSVVETLDGGFLLGASSGSTNGDRTGPYFGRGDFWLVRLDSAGRTQWDRSYGGTNDDTLFTVQQTGDGFILGGWTWSGPSGNKASPSHGALDYWLVRVDGDGNKVWDASFGGTGEDYFYGLAQTPDGGFAAAGESFSTNGTRTAASFGSSDYWLVRTDANGNKLWDTSYGGASVDSCFALDAVGGGGFLLGGLSGSLPGSGTKTSPRWGSRDYWIVRTDSAGNSLWDASFGSTNLDAIFAVKTLPDGGFILGGRSHGEGGNKTTPHFGNGDYWLVRVDSVGTKMWERSFGGDAFDELHTLALTRDGGFLLGGWASSYARGNKTSPNLGGFDFWVIRTDGVGNKLWEQTFGTDGSDYLYGVQQTTDGGYILAGFTIPTNVNSRADLLVIKLAPESPALLAKGAVDGGFAYSIVGESNRLYVTEYSPDLVTWHPLTTNIAPDIELQLLDRSATNASTRFYRARRP